MNFVEITSLGRISAGQSGGTVRLHPDQSGASEPVVTLLVTGSQGIILGLGRLRKESLAPEAPVTLCSGLPGPMTYFILSLRRKFAGKPLEQHVSG